jgi:CRP-like cAMP-binding protein
MQVFARNAGTTMTFKRGSIIFKEGEPAKSVYIVHSGMIEILTHDKIVDLCGPNDVIGFMSVIDGGPMTASARVRNTAEVSVLDERAFHSMIEKVPNFALYIMRAMAHRIRGMRELL